MESDIAVVWDQPVESAGANGNGYFLMKSLNRARSNAGKVERLRNVLCKIVNSDKKSVVRATLSGYTDPKLHNRTEMYTFPLGLQRVDCKGVEQARVPDDRGLYGVISESMIEAIEIIELSLDSPVPVWYIDKGFFQTLDGEENFVPFRSPYTYQLIQPIQNCKAGQVFLVQGKKRREFQLAGDGLARAARKTDTIVKEITEVVAWSEGSQWVGLKFSRSKTNSNEKARCLIQSDMASIFEDHYGYKFEVALLEYRVPVSKKKDRPRYYEVLSANRIPVDAAESSPVDRGNNS